MRLAAIAILAALGLLVFLVVREDAPKSPDTGPSAAEQISNLPARARQAHESAQLVARGPVRFRTEEMTRRIAREKQTARLARQRAADDALAELRASHDIDGNGRIEGNELVEYERERALILYEVSDADHNGVVTRSEFAAHRHNASNLVGSFDEVDSDGDGQLTSNEFESAALSRVNSSEGLYVSVETEKARKRRNRRERRRKQRQAAQAAPASEEAAATH